MSACPKPTIQPANGSAVNVAFLRYLPAVRTHARIQFRRLRRQDREEAVAEAVAVAFINFSASVRNGKAHRVTAATMAKFAVLHVRDGGHVGGGTDSRCDAMSFKAQGLRGFSVVGLGNEKAPIYDCMTDPTRPVWKQVLHEDRRTYPADQAAFRVDLSQFLAEQSDRTRTLLSMLAEGHRQIEVADEMGLTPSALCQRRKRALREWDRLQRNAAPLNHNGQRKESTPYLAAPVNQ